MAFSVDFCFTKQLGTKGLDVATRWPRVWRWLNALKARQSWKDAQEKTGDDLNRQV
jgi:glutathione S-transferase